ncbi:MAG: hypothetical protein AAGE52_22930 [Myxococcota bacterium]
MKKVIGLVAFGLVACSPKMVEVDLSSAGLNATMQAPEGAQVERKPLGVVVTAEQFEVSVWNRTRDLAEERARGSQDRYTLVVDEADAVLLEFEAMGGPFYTATVNVDVGGSPWSCATDPLANVNDEAAGMRMLEACRSLKAK